MGKFGTLGIFMALAVCCAATAIAAGPAQSGRTVSSLDRDWRFHLGEVEGGDKPGFDVSTWRTLDVPHDFSIEGPPGADPSTMEGPFDSKCPGGAGTGYLDGGIGWYRKTFTLPEATPGKVVLIQFDGVYMDSDVWLNGEHLGNHPYGYTSFFYNVSKQVKFGVPNELAVRTVVKQPCSRWYSGAGIFRHVWLTLADPVHVVHWGTYVTTPEIHENGAKVQVRTRICNAGAAASKVTLNTTLLDPRGEKVAQAEAVQEVPPDGRFEFDQPLHVGNVRRWSLEDPALYQAVSELRVDGRLTDRYTTPFGIRTCVFTADQGMLLNGKHVPIYGVCDHHDLGCLGSAVNRRGIQRQLEILKAMGCNAIRTSHNPPAPELLDLCDQMGLVVMDEAFDEWKSGKTRYGYGRFFDDWSERDLVSMLHRDRNHPCIVMWSIGNEISEQGAKNGGEMAKRLADICHREDPTRAVTSACNNPGGAAKTGYAAALDVFGINYNIAAYKKFQGKVLVASETASALSTRGEYNLVAGKDGKLEIKKQLNHQCTSYDLCNPGWGHTAETSLRALKESPWVAGEFVWTGFDYIGEPTPYNWPSRSSYFGIVDLCGFPKDRFYLYQSRWTDKPMVHLLPHWNWQGFEGKEIPVWCFTNAESVELLLNGKSLGKQDCSATTKLHLEWSVPYQPGVLKAVASKGGQTVAVDEVYTAGKPARLMVTPDRLTLRADGDDLSFVEVRVVDADGHLCPNAADEIALSLAGPGAIAGVGNGDPTNHESFQAHKHLAFHGLCLAVIRAGREPGQIRLAATAQGLQSSPVSIDVAAPVK